MARPAATSTTPITTSRADDEPVRGSCPDGKLDAFWYTDVEVITLGAIVVEDVAGSVVPLGSTVVAVVGASMIVVVVDGGGSTVVVVVVGEGGSTVVVVVVGGATVVVVVVGGATVVVVVVGGATVVVVVVVVGGGGGTTVVVVVVDVDVVVDVEVEVVELEVVVVVCPPPPQNWMLETAGVLPAPTFGNPEFEKCPDVGGGDSDVITAPGPPLTMIQETAAVDDQLPPVEEPFVMCTTPELPVGPAKTYFPPVKSNFARRVVPAGQFTFPPLDTVVSTRPATTNTAPTISITTPEYHGRSVRNL